MKPGKFFATLLFGILALTPQGLKAQEPRTYLLSTASTGGTYYPVGVAIANLIKIRLQASMGISLSAISSAGSAENVKLLREKQVEFAILQGIFGVWAWNGEGPIEINGPQQYLRGLTMLWQNVEHFVIQSDLVVDGTLDDLKRGQNILMSVGSRNSGSEASNKFVFETLGIMIGEDLTPAFLGYSQGADALRNGTIDAMSAPAGVPVGAVTQAFASLGGGLTILNISDEDMDKLNAGFDLWARHVLPANTYPGQANDVQSLAMPNVLAVHADVDEETVYQITRTIYENLPFLRSIHRATAEMEIDQAVAHMPLPLHPGALRYYREVGLPIPDELIPE